MGSMVSELLDIASLGRKAQKEIKGDPDHVKDSKTVAAFFQKAKSISSRASKYVLEYPTICSSSISDYNTALAIAKQVEFDCARFVVLSAGLNPFVRLDKDDTISAHINDLISSYEDYSGLKLSIKPATEDEIRNCEQWLNSGDFNKPYQSFKTNSFSNESFLSMEMDTVNTNAPEVQSGGGLDTKMEASSTEPTDTNPYISAVDEVMANHPDWDTMYGKTSGKLIEESGVFNPGVAKDISGFSYRQYKRDSDGNIEVDDKGNQIIETKIIGKRPSDPEAAKKWDAANAYFLEKTKSNGVASIGQIRRQEEILSKLGKVGPTIVTINFYLIDSHGGQREIGVPLAIKSNLQFINSADIFDLMSNTKTPTTKFQKLIKLTTGEINFFKDFILGLDEAKKDTERERNIGHTPFYRRLLSNKSRYKIKNVSETLPSLKGIVAKKSQKDLPMFTIIVDELEITQASGIKFSYMLKDRSKWIDYFLDTYMLLGIGVVDKDNDVIYFFYSGEDDYNMVKISDAGKKSGDSNINSALATAMANMSRMISR